MSLRFVAMAGFVALLLPAAVYGEDLGRAEELVKAGKYKEAAALLRTLTDAGPDQARANYLLGISLLEQNEVDASEPRLKKALKLKYAQDQVKVGLGRIHLQRQQFDRALGLLNEAQAADPGNPEVYLYRGIAHANLGQGNEAVQDLEKAIQMKPDEPKAHYYAGLAYNRVKRPDKMVEHFQMFLKLAPEAPEAARVRSLLRNLR